MPAVYLLKKSLFAQFAIFIAFLLLTVTLGLAVNYLLNRQDPDVLGLCHGISPCYEYEDPVTVSGFIRMTAISFTVHPEKRIPRTNNWDTVTNVVLENCSTSATRTFNNIPTNNLGTGTITIPINSPVADGNYRFYVRGSSHLNERFNCYTLATIHPNIPLYLENKDLLAGEVSVIYDNHINALDLSILINDLYTSSYVSDVNQDGEVNALDLGNQIFNIFKTGD